MPVLLVPGWVPVLSTVLGQDRLVNHVLLLAPGRGETPPLHRTPHTALVIELQTEVKPRFAKISQTRRRLCKSLDYDPSCGPSFEALPGALPWSGQTARGRLCLGTTGNWEHYQLHCSNMVVTMNSYLLHCSFCLSCNLLVMLPKSPRLLLILS